MSKQVPFWTNACEMLCMFSNKLSLRVTIQLVRLPIYLVFSCNTTVAKFRGQCSLFLCNLVFSHLFPAWCTARRFRSVCDEISIKYHEFVPKSDPSYFCVIYYKMTQTTFKQLIVAGWGSLVVWLSCLRRQWLWLQIGSRCPLLHSHQSVSLRTRFCNRICSPLCQLHSSNEE